MTTVQASDDDVLLGDVELYILCITHLLMRLNGSLQVNWYQEKDLEC